MPRNQRSDSVLSTGMSSALERKQREKWDKAHAARQDRRQALTPSADIILEWIEKEMNDCADLRKTIINVATEDHVKAQLLAKQMHLDFLESMKNRVKNTLRVAKAADRKAEREALKNAPEAWKDAANTEETVDA